MGMFPSRKQVEDLRWACPAGTRVRLLVMDDPHAPLAGTCGTVSDVDDVGQIRMRWDTGRSLHLVPGMNIFRILEDGEELPADLKKTERPRP